MNTQEAYEVGRAHFLTPGTDYGYNFDTGNCEYRVGGYPESPNRCFIGASLPDTLYDSEMDLSTSNFADICSEYTEVGDFYLGCDISLMQDLQSVHDRCAMDNIEMDVFISRLDAKAESFGLRVPTA